MRTTWRKTVFLSAAIALLACGLAGGAGEAKRPADDVVSDTAWEGIVLVERPVTVRKGAVLTVRPGTVVSFAKGARLTAEGVLVAKGNPDAPVRFVSANGDPSPGYWEGIRFGEFSAGSILSRCVILGASAVEIAARGVEVLDCEIGSGIVGLIVHPGANPGILRNTVRDMSGGGIRCGQESSPVIEGNVVRSCGPFGIECDHRAAPVVRENRISGCEKGMTFGGVIPPVTGNVFRGNVAGLVATSAGEGQEIRGNRFEGNELGLFCEHFSSPLVEGNTFTGNKTALVCFRSSSPAIRRNVFAENEQGIGCSQLSGPRIEGNEIRGNGKGIYLTLSSYAVVRGNNIHGNGVQMELGMMSSDWERKAREKPLRGGAAAQAGQAGRGVLAPRPEGVDEGSARVSVDATGNWWGDRDTEEMERKGPDADIGGIVDYHDSPTNLTEDGKPGMYEKDRVRYEGWKKSPIPGAGLPAESGIEGKVVRDGEAVADARVYAYRTFADAMAMEPFAVSGPSAPDGSWRLDLPPGKWFLAGKKRKQGAGDGPLAVGDDFGFHGGNPVTVAPGKRPRLGLSLVRFEAGAAYGEIPDKSSGSLGGVVTWKGNPTEGVDVLLYLDDRHDFRGMPYAISAPTGEDGGFLFESLPEAAYYLLARKRSTGKGAGPLSDGDTFGFYPANPVPVKAGSILRVRFGVIRKTSAAGRDDAPLLEGDTGMAGRILDRDGRPVPGAYAFVYTEKAMSHKRPDHISRPADEEGRYVLRIPRGGKYFLGARSEYGDTPAPGEWYGRYEGTPDHSILLSTGQLLDRIDVVVERVLR